jgi:hypothetical protein
VPDPNHVSTQKLYAICFANWRCVAPNEAKLLDTSNLLPIRMMHHSKTITPFTSRLGEAL